MNGKRERTKLPESVRLLVPSAIECACRDNHRKELFEAIEEIRGLTLISYGPHSFDSRLTTFHYILSRSA